MHFQMIDSMVHAPNQHRPSSFPQDGYHNPYPNPHFHYQPSNHLTAASIAQQRFHHDGPSIDQEVEEIRHGLHSLQRGFFRFSKEIGAVRDKVNESLSALDVGVEGVANDVHNAKLAILDATSKFPTRGNYLAVLLLVDLAIWCFAGFLLFKIYQGLRRGRQQQREAMAIASLIENGETGSMEGEGDRNSERRSWPEKVQLLIPEGSVDEVEGGKRSSAIRRLDSWRDGDGI